MQRAVAVVLEAVYEQDIFGLFLWLSTEALRARCAESPLASIDGHMAWVVEVDVRQFFDTVDKKRLREILRRTVRDGVLLRLFVEWLNIKARVYASDRKALAPFVGAR